VVSERGVERITESRLIDHAEAPASDLSVVIKLK